MQDLLVDNYKITRLLHRYNASVDEYDFITWASCFADGGVFDGAYQLFTLPQDLEKFKALALGIMDSNPNLRHFTTNLVIDIDGDTATAKSFLLLLSTPNYPADGTIPVSQIIQAGTYHDDLVRVDGHWKIKLRRVTVDGLPTGGRIGSQVPEEIATDPLPIASRIHS